MSDVWYYADGGDARGPMSLAALTAAIAQAPQPGHVLVWRAGLTEWQRAADVSDVAASLRRPPPVTADSPLASHPTDTPASVRVTDPAHVTDANMRPAKNAELTGIGGWLVLLAIGQVVGPLRFLATIVQYYATLEGDLFRQFPATFVGEALMNAAVGLLYLATAILFFRKSKRFPRFFVYQVIATALIIPLNALWVAATISMTTGGSMGTVLQGLIEPREAGRTAMATIVGIIWIVYLFKSKRVANTFVN